MSGLPKISELTQMYKEAKKEFGEMEKNGIDWKDLLKAIPDINQRTKLIIIKMAEIEEKLNEMTAQLDQITECILNKTVS